MLILPIYYTSLSALRFAPGRELVGASRPLLRAMQSITTKTEEPPKKIMTLHDETNRDSIFTGFHFTGAGLPPLLGKPEGILTFLYFNIC